MERRWRILIRPVLDESKKLVGSIFAIERLTRINAALVSGDSSVYKVEGFVLSDVELRASKEFSYTSAGERLEDLIGDDKLPKMLLAETPKTIKYVTFDIAVVDVESSGDSRSYEAPDEVVPTTDRPVIQAPFTYDIKYTNSEGVEHVLEGLPQSEQFVFRIRSGRVKVGKGESHMIQQYLKGKIFPLGYASGVLEVQLVISAEDASYDSTGQKHLAGRSSYAKTISFDTDDVVEVRLPDRFPAGSIGQPYDPMTLKQDSRYYFDTSIEKQSLFIRPVKMK